jgi:hypothetical protein
MHIAYRRMHEPHYLTVLHVPFALSATATRVRVLLGPRLNQCW